MSSYPDAIPSLTNPTATDKQNSTTVPHATQHADVNNEIEAICIELGVNPKSTYDSVAAYLAALAPLASPTFTGTVVLPYPFTLGSTSVTSTAAELNVLDGIPSTLTAAELGYVDGVTSAIQTQLDAKIPNSGTVFLFHADGADAATTYTAETGQTLTFAGNAQLDTADKEFGSASALFDGTGDYITAPASADWNFTGDFTIDFWWKGNNLNKTLIKSVSNETWADATTNDWLLAVGSAGKLAFYVKNVYTLEFNSVLSTGVWYHIAIVRSSGVLKCYVNGIAEADTRNDATTLGNTQVLNIGAVETGLTLGLNGWIDEVRILNGVARHTSNFSVNTLPYTLIVY